MLNLAGALAVWVVRGWIMDIDLKEIDRRIEECVSK